MSFLIVDKWHEAEQESPYSLENYLHPEESQWYEHTYLAVWNRANLFKLLWNISGKFNSLWVKWVHIYYLKNQQLMDARVHANFSWIMKVIMNQRDSTQHLQAWDDMKQMSKFNMRAMYQALHQSTQKMEQRKMLYGNLARPRAIITLWIACHEKLATKARLHKRGLVDNMNCCFCDAFESQQHMFECKVMKDVWERVWKGIHVQGWNQEIQWIVQNSKGKGKRAIILKLVAAQSIYEIQRYIN